jgi:uncharacterized membrane protein YphA (DoxX/SURF4 family)
MTRKIICIFIGIVYLASGLGKIGNTAAFGNLIYQYGLGHLQLLAPLIVLAEIAVGLGLILYGKPKLLSLCSGVLVLLFTVTFSYGYLKNGITNCGCFGAFSLGSGNVWVVYLRNTVLFGLSLFAWLSIPEDEDKINDWKKSLILGIMLPMIFIAGYSFRPPASSDVKKAHDFLNKPVNETRLSGYINTTADKSYLVLFFSYDCPHCWNTVQNYKHFKESRTVDSLLSFALISADSVANVANRNTFIESFGNFITEEIVNDETVQSFIEFLPTSFYVEKDTVKAVMESELPSSLTFQKMMHKK